MCEWVVGREGGERRERGSKGGRRESGREKGEDREVEGKRERGECRETKVNSIRGEEKGGGVYECVCKCIEVHEDEEGLLRYCHSKLTSESEQSKACIERLHFVAS